MVEGPKPASEIEAMKQELADIKNEMMRKELEEIKREKMKKELEELKAENAKKQEEPRYVPLEEPKLSIPNFIMAIVALVAGGYMIGTLYTFNLADDIDRLIAGYSLPIGGTLIVAIVVVILLFVGAGLVTITRK